MKLFGIAGWSGCGKTTLILKLIPVLTARGVRVATLKHSHHGQAFADAPIVRGATQTVFAGPERWALVNPLADGEPSLSLLSRQFRGVDLLLVEGFKRQPHPKIEVYSAACGQPPLAADDPSIKALACDEALTVREIRCFRRNSIGVIADFILASAAILG